MDFTSRITTISISQFLRIRNSPELHTIAT